ncbi:hypothetical protein TNCT_496501 [Trichonephila clavata]|uniref:Uncharacterized protein n=1 Tax=Trichonephila clavata TaxID=2740835 RepID=A0A8X6L2V2_TRICU|nr:hypothetical protein TNCT_496501 [Trichonephila clavata]
MFDDDDAGGKNRFLFFIIFLSMILFISFPFVSGIGEKGHGSLFFTSICVSEVKRFLVLSFRIIVGSLPNPSPFPQEGGARHILQEGKYRKSYERTTMYHRTV